MIVVEASVLIDLLLRRPNAPAIDARLFDGRPSLHAPDLVDIEIAQVVRRYCLVGQLTSQRARDATYVALAELLGATLLTADQRLAKTSGLRVHVEVLECFPRVQRWSRHLWLWTYHPRKALKAK